MIFSIKKENRPTVCGRRPQAEKKKSKINLHLSCFFCYNKAINKRTSFVNFVNKETFLYTFCNFRWQSKIYLNKEILRSRSLYFKPATAFNKEVQKSIAKNINGPAACGRRPQAEIVENYIKKNLMGLQPAAAGRRLKKINSNRVNKAKSQEVSMTNPSLFLIKVGDNNQESSFVNFASLENQINNPISISEARKGEKQKTKFYTSYSKLSEIKLLTIGIATPLRILQWAEKTLPNGKIYGEVLNANTLHHKTFKPQKGGLFCERIFGPLKDFECACGKINKSNKQLQTTSSLNSIQDSQTFNENGPAAYGRRPQAEFEQKLITNLNRKYCPDCDVEYTWSVIRRYQLGYIKLCSPVTHIWFLKGTPSYLSLLLDMKKRYLQFVTYCSEILTIEKSSIPIYSYSISYYNSNINYNSSFLNNTNTKITNIPSSISLENNDLLPKAISQGFLNKKETEDYKVANFVKLITLLKEKKTLKNIKSKNLSYLILKDRQNKNYWGGSFNKKLNMQILLQKQSEKKFNNNNNNFLKEKEGSISQLDKNYLNFFKNLNIMKLSPSSIWYSIPVFFKNRPAEFSNIISEVNLVTGKTIKNHKVGNLYDFSDTSNLVFASVMQKEQFVNEVNKSLQPNKKKIGLQSAAAGRKLKEGTAIISILLLNLYIKKFDIGLQPAAAGRRLKDYSGNTFFKKLPNIKNILKKLPIDLYILCLLEPILHKSSLTLALKKTWKYLYKQTFIKSIYKAKNIFYKYLISLKLAKLTKLELLIAKTPFWQKVSDEFLGKNMQKSLAKRASLTPLEKNKYLIFDKDNVGSIAKLLNKDLQLAASSEARRRLTENKNLNFKKFLLFIQNQQIEDFIKTEEPPLITFNIKEPSLIFMALNHKNKRGLISKKKVGGFFKKQNSILLKNLKNKYMNHLFRLFENIPYEIISLNYSTSFLQKNDLSSIKKKISLDFINYLLKKTNFIQKILIKNFLNSFILDFYYLFISKLKTFSFFKLTSNPNSKKRGISHKNVLGVCFVNLEFSLNSLNFLNSNETNINYQGLVLSYPLLKASSSLLKVGASHTGPNFKKRGDSKEIFYSDSYFLKTRKNVNAIINAVLNTYKSYLRFSNTVIQWEEKNQPAVIFASTSEAPVFASATPAKVNTKGINFSGGFMQKQKVRKANLVTPSKVNTTDINFSMGGLSKNNSTKDYNILNIFFTSSTHRVKTKNLTCETRVTNNVSEAREARFASFANSKNYLQYYTDHSLDTKRTEIKNRPVAYGHRPQAEKLLYNNIYTLSHKERWAIEKDWQIFTLFSFGPTNYLDYIIPKYKNRLFALKNETQNISFSLSFSSPRLRLVAQSQANKVREANLVSFASSFFSGAGIVQQLLNEFDFYEIKKLDKQNRLILYQLNKYILKLKKQVQIFVYDKNAQIELRELCKKRDLLIRRTKLVRKLFRKNSNPTSMILNIIPVLPPDLRPIVKMGNQIAASDLNRLYQRVIYRNDRLKKFLKDAATSQSYEMKYAQRLLQEAVDNLLQNGKSGSNSEKDSRGRALKSLSDVLKGKQGRFRQFLLGKRVDYSGRSVIVVGPKLKLHECGLPLEMAKELYLPFLLKSLLNKNYAKTVIGAKTLIKNNSSLANELLREIMQVSPILLNRAPTLHRLGFQAFIPKLIEGRAILLHPLVCSAFNADFDGDQMAVHVPITIEARAEAWKLMLSKNNLLSTATGDPLAIPSQDMVLGCYYLTTFSNHGKILKGSGMFFNSLQDVIKLYDQRLINIHSLIWVKWTNFIENSNEQENNQSFEIRLSSFGQWQEITSNSYRIYDSYNNLINQYILTTPGRILFNLLIQKIIQ